VKNPFRSQTFASCSVDFTIKIWSLDDHKKPRQTLNGHFGYVVDIAWAGLTILNILISTIHKSLSGHKLASSVNIGSGTEAYKYD
jgi:WD40 repeat protein